MAIININGNDLYYRESGSGEPLVLVHGSGFNADVWERVMDDLALDLRVIVYDRRGCQRSKGTPPGLGNYGHQQGEDLAGMLRALAAFPANILGWSAGGIFALHAARAHPELVRRLVLYEPPQYILRFLDLPFLAGFTKTNLLRLMGRKRSASESFMKMILAYQDGRNSFDRFSPEFQDMLARDAKVLLDELLAVAADYPRPDVLRTGLQAPVTMLIGEMTPAPMKRAAENLAVVLENVTTLRLHGSNHLAHLDQPDQFVEAVRAALN